jgi:protein-tyrosine-phosphatase
MKIHFVCTGNTFRSRLAEAYLKSKKIKGLEISSSGVEAAKNVLGPISWYTKRILSKNGLIHLDLPETWTQTSKELLRDQDLVIFMRKWHYDQATQNFGFTGRKYEIWDIDDVPVPHLENSPSNVVLTEEIYEKIKKNVDGLLARDFKPKNL